MTTYFLRNHFRILHRTDNHFNKDVIMEELKLIDIALIFALVINGILIGLTLYLNREKDFWKMMYNYSERQNNKLFEDNKELADELKRQSEG